ncbi:diguanylate cyclase (GGDEF)-like protein [Xylophilus ampelinus]|uniref:diguanylate cyclase n=2 Tax=Xylophilus ampelinus TaxID=54067 RepID=A0A318SQN9_9BURK|nr:diguanylate cyclase (GGDEF)-like protein [Xylophilus ampelinus]
MTLARLSVVITSLIAVLVTALFTRILLDEWRRYRSLGDGLVSMQAASHALVAAEKIAFERGPMNAVLGDGDTPVPEHLAQLATARAHSDEMMDRLVDYIRLAGRDADLDTLPQLADTARALARARGEVDRLAGLPRARRDPAAVRQTQQDMFAVVPPLMAAHTTLSRNATDAYQPMSEGMTGARMCAELREYAGQLGSQFTVALTGRQPLTSAEQQSIGFLQGRLAQLQTLVQRPLMRLPPDAPARVALDTMDRHYFGSGLQLVALMQERSRRGEPYGYDAAGFARRYVPDMQPIVGLRDVLVREAFAEKREARSTARRRLVIAGGLSGLILAALAVSVWALQRRVVRPLLAAAQTLRDIADGQLDKPVPVSDRTDEVGAVQKALHRLRTVAVENRRLEREQIHLIEDLERLSLTDPLTGILNRRAFTEALRTSATRADARHLPIAVMLFDIDHFKQVNDRHGHEAGDRVLMRVAAVAQNMLRTGETVARYGGEEFIVLLVHPAPSGAMRAAERLRSGIEAACIDLQNGQTVRVTASFGVATAPNALCNLEDLLRAADTALYAAKAQGRNRVVLAPEPAASHEGPVAVRADRESPAGHPMLQNR